MARMSAQSRSPRDAGGGRAQRCAPSAHEFWRRRRVREECRRAPLAGGGRGKFSGAGADVPATAIGIQPCNRERCATGRGEQSSPCRHRPTPGHDSAARIRVPTPIHQGRCGSEKTPRWCLRRSSSRRQTGRASTATSRCAPRLERQNSSANGGKHLEPGPRNSSLAAANLEPCRRPGAGDSSSRPPRRHADRLARSCVLICDIRIGPSENSPALAFSVRPRR
jgi:hypothetical protein